METASILNYRGDANLAAGTGGEGLAEEGLYDFSPIINSLNDLSRRANQVKDIEYKQKISDRNRIFDKIATMEADLDKALPEHQQLLRDKRDEVERIFLESPDILSDKEAYVKMQKALGDFNDLNAYTKTNYVTTTNDLLTASKIADPDDRAAMMKHIGEQRKKLAQNPRELYEPYAKPLQWSYDDMFKKVAPTEKTVGTDPATGYDIKKSYTDPNTMLQNYQFDVVEGNNKTVANQLKDWMAHYGQLKSPQEKINDFDGWNRKIELANKYITDPGKKLKPIPFDRETGDPMFGANFSPDDFSRDAYVAYRFTEETKVVPPTKEELAAKKNAAEIGHLKNQDAIAAMKAKTDAVYKGTLGAAAMKKADAYASKISQAIKGMKTVEEQDQMLDELYKRNLVQQPELIQGKGGNNVVLANIPAQNSLPVFTLKGKLPEQLIPIDATPVYDKYDVQPNPKSSDKDKQAGVPAKSAKILYYKGGHYQPIYMFNGKRVDTPELSSIYQNFKKIAAERGQEWKGSMNDWIKQGVNEGALEFLMKGANGTTDRKLSLAAQRAISNQATKKGQDGVFEEIPDDVSVPDNNDPE